jgi:hypothetical protein
MRRILLLIVLALSFSSCERDCEAFDRSREIAKWHLFPELNSEYVFESTNEERIFIKRRGEIDKFETIKCLSDCDCTRLFTGDYEDERLNLQCVIVYDQDGEFKPTPISYDFDYRTVEFDVTSWGEIIGEENDSVPMNLGIEYENIDTITFGNTLYDKVLHVYLPNEADVSDYWIARGVGLVAFQEDSVRFIRK